MGNETSKPSVSTTSKEAAVDVEVSDKTSANKRIKQMDSKIRAQVRRRSIAPRLKLLLRGDRGSGKSSLFARLQGKSIPDSHVKTECIKNEKIHWHNGDETVSIELWDVVDEGIGHDENGEEVAWTAEEKVQNGMVDATTVNVYHGAHGVIFLMDITKVSSLEYVKRELEFVPKELPTLVLGTFRDLGNQRKVFKEDINALLLGKRKGLKRPLELQYFECSLLNCYNLPVLHKYLRIPMLLFNLGTLRQQVRLLESDLAHAKQNIQIVISEQRYRDYVDYIEKENLDIKTGRSRSFKQTTHPVPEDNAGDEACEEFNITEDAEDPVKTPVIKKCFSQDSSDALADENASITSNAESTGITRQSSLQSDLSEDQTELMSEDLPERRRSNTSNSLKIVYEKPNSSESEKNAAPVVEEHHPEATQAAPLVYHRPRKSDETLDEFKVGASIDNFYSSEDESDLDQDIVVPISSGVSNLQRKAGFIYSDSEDEGNEEVGKNLSAPRSPLEEVTVVVATPISSDLESKEQQCSKADLDNECVMPSEKNDNKSNAVEDESDFRSSEEEDPVQQIVCEGQDIPDQESEAGQCTSKKEVKNAADSASEERKSETVPCEGSESEDEAPSAVEKDHEEFESSVTDTEALLSPSEISSPYRNSCASESGGGEESQELQDIPNKSESYNMVSKEDSIDPIAENGFSVNEAELNSFLDGSSEDEDVPINTTNYDTNYKALEAPVVIPNNKKETKSNMGDESKLSTSVLAAIQAANDMAMQMQTQTRTQESNVDTKVASKVKKKKKRSKSKSKTKESKPK